MILIFVLLMSARTGEDVIQQFRITAWPGLLPHPPVGNLLAWTLSEDGVLVTVAPLMFLDVPDLEVGPLLRARAGDREFDRGDADDISAVGEIYLELVNLDLEDEKAILQFVGRFGVLGVAHEHFALVRSLPGLATAILPALAAAWPTERFNQRVEDYLARRGEGPNTDLVETLAEFRFGARVLRDLVTAARIARLEAPPPTIQWESIPEEALEDKRADLADWGIELDALGESVEIFLRQVLTDGLRPFQPRVLYARGVGVEQPTEASGAAEDEALDDLVEEPLTRDEVVGGEIFEAPLYAVCCLELFNHLVEHAEVKMCANERCGRPFARQRGRAEHGQYRLRGVKYCSTYCARAQAQRAYRRRLTGSAGSAGGSD
jgi:hypothetical protein